jgi:predicted nucleotidyltransferase
MDSIERIKEKLLPIFDNEPIERAILFGSYAKGSNDELSDVDIVIDSKGRLIGLDFYRLLDLVVRTLELDVDLFDVSEIVNGSTLQMEIDAGGVLLYERKIA